MRQDDFGHTSATGRTHASGPEAHGRGIDFLTEFARSRPAALRRRSVVLTALFQITLGVGVAAAAVVSGVSVDSGNKSWVVLPLAAVVGLALASLALTRFAGFVVLLLGARASIDVLQLSGDRSGTTGGNTVVERGIDPSSLIGVLFLASAMLWLAARSHSGVNIRPSRLTAAYASLIFPLAYTLYGLSTAPVEQRAT